MTLALAPYSTRFHAMRRLLHKELTGSALKKYEPLHEQESRSLIKKVLQDPFTLQDAIRQWVHVSNFFPLFRFITSVICSYAGTVILKVTYGYQTAPQGDRFLVLAEKVMSAFSQASQPSAWLVDIVPWSMCDTQSLPLFDLLTFSTLVRHVPDWFPGAHFKRIAAHWKRLNMDAMTGPYNWTKANQVHLLLSYFVMAFSLIDFQIGYCIHDEAQFYIYYIDSK